MYKSKYFETEELVSRATYEKMGERALIFIPKAVIEGMDLLREKVGRDMTINTWHENPIGYELNGMICYDDKPYKTLVERTRFNMFYKKWFGMEYHVRFHGLSAEEVIKIVDLKEHESINTIRPCTLPGQDTFVTIEFKGNE